jgi:type VI secretion system protein ImpB
MAQDSSVAPKERVNIRFKPGTGDSKEEVELPLKMLVVGDFTLRADDTPIEDRQLSNVNKENFQDVMRSYNLSLAINAENRLEEDPSNPLPVQLKFQSVRDFEPERIVEQVPQMRQLLELRSALLALKGPLGNVPAFRKSIQQTMDDSDTRQKLLSELGLGGDV